MTTTSTPAPDSNPIGLDSIVGHASARRLLAERVRAGALPHALLMSGPRGVGKRTLARALAAEHFCVERRGCGACAACGALARGNHPGFVEVGLPDGRSAIPIDSVKQLERELSLCAPDERGRIVLLRGADLLTPPAQDALLKTLEEPPPGNVLLLTAVRSDAVLATIRSRCQRITLAPLLDSELAELAARLGLASSVPLAVARGCPGELAALRDPQVERLRRGVLKLLTEERGGDDLARIVALLHDGLGDSDADAAPAALRARARLLLTLIESFARDVVVWKASGASDIIRNVDQLERLATLTSRDEWSDAFDLLGRLARAHDRVEGNVDPASALYCVLHPEIEAATSEGVGEARGSGWAA